MLAKQYFEALVKATNTYKQNMGDGTAGQNKYESANQLVDCDDEICYYIVKIASAVTANNDLAANTQAEDTQFDVMSAQIKARTVAVGKLTTATRTSTQTPTVAIKARARDSAPRCAPSPSS